MEPWELSASEMSRLIAAKELSPVELTESALARVEAIEPSVNAFVTVMADEARTQAKAAADEIARGHHRGPLHGIPVGIKDLIDTAGTPTTSSSKVRESFVPDEDAVVVTQLRNSGAVILGKTHTHEFAFGAVTPQTKNPWSRDAIAGGSSGGSAAAVAYGAVPIALGSDTGGSIRIPAACCGTVGLKPTYGRVPRCGVASLSWSLDHVGPLTRNVRDAAWAMNAIAGYDPRDPGSVARDDEDFTRALETSVKGLRIGVPTNWFTTDVDPICTAAAQATIDTLVAAGAEVVDVELPYEEHLMAAEWAILMPEASAYHRRALRETPELFTEEVRGLLEVGETVLATDYVDALRLRGLIKDAWREMMRDVDVAIAPTIPTPALPAASPAATWPSGRVEPATQAYVRFSLPMNLTGLPSLQVPAGLTDQGLPLGVQMMGKPFAEAELLGIGAALEATTGSIGKLAPISAS